MDKIFIRDLTVNCIIGILPRERVTPQQVQLNLVLECDLSAAAASDDIADTVDYKQLKDAIVERVERSEELLIERLAQRVADLCLEHPRVQRVTVCLDKPGALTRARSVAVEITRERG